jgi:hypothetical protein
MHLTKECNLRALTYVNLETIFLSNFTHTHTHTRVFNDSFVIAKKPKARAKCQMSGKFKRDTRARAHTHTFINSHTFGTVTSELQLLP